MGMNDEAEHMQKTLARRRVPPTDSMVAEPEGID
jgi:hypothetical protein